MALYLGNIKIAGGSGSGNANIVSCDNYDDYIAKRDINIALGKLSVTYYTPDEGMISPTVLSGYAVLSGGNDISGHNLISSIMAMNNLPEEESLENKSLIMTNENGSYNVPIDKIISYIYPIGSIYFGIQEICPLSLMIPGSKWEQIGSKILTDIGSSVSLSGTAKCRGDGYSLGLDFTKVGGIPERGGMVTDSQNSNFVGVSNTATHVPLTYEAGITYAPTVKSGVYQPVGLTTIAHQSGIVCDLSSAEVTAHIDSESSIALNIWKRIA